MYSGGSIIFYDCECVFCNKWIMFILKRSSNMFVYPQQSDTCKTFLHSHGWVKSAETILFFENGKIYTESDAVIRIFANMNGLWKGLYMLKLVPEYFRNKIYRIIAINRYRWFGRINTCELPDTLIRQRIRNFSLTRSVPNA
jgi:predicted DCC family thiol-disulfide oxidoreductase YuxK